MRNPPTQSETNEFCDKQLGRWRLAGYRRPEVHVWAAFQRWFAENVAERERKSMESLAKKYETRDPNRKR